VESRQKGQTRIEEIMQKILDELGIYYTVEEKMGHWKKNCTEYQADFRIDQSIIIEVDGNYWHAHPDYYDPTDNTGDKEKHEAIIEKDEKRDDYLQDEGYHVVRVWGSTIKQQRDEVKNKISQILNGGDLPPNGSHVFGPEPIPESAI
jgi:very-short-patch-repair endonuclease